jgi:hypothetical protein
MTLTVPTRAASLPAGLEIPADAVPAPAAADLTAAPGETTPRTLACQRDGAFLSPAEAPRATGVSLRPTGNPTVTGRRPGSGRASASPRQTLATGRRG